MAAYDRIFNFSAGPSMLPVPALERAAKEMMNYGGSGMSVMEMSHRSKAFQQIFDDTQAKLRRLMNVPENYKILFLQTGASGQFSMVPLNLIGKTGKADYAVTGNFASIACKEAKKYGEIHVAASTEEPESCASSRAARVFSSSEVCAESCPLSSCASALFASSAAFSCATSASFSESVCRTEAISSFSREASAERLVS